MSHRASVCTAVTALWILGSACSTSGSGGSGGASNGGSSSGGAGKAGSSGGGGAGSGGNLGSGGAGSGGAPATGGSTGGTTQPASCPNGSPCGGDLVGTWNVTSSCLKLSGDMDVSSVMGCKTVPATGFLQVTGTWTAKADLSYTDNTTTTGSITFPLDASCLTVSSVPVECSKMANQVNALGWKAATCSTNASGQCNCSATASQSGGIGVVSPWWSNSGTYTTSGSGLNTDDTVDYSYCVSGSTLTMTPKPTILPVTGTVVLQKSGTPGTGGAGGAGGASTGAGGKTGAGGATTGSGGATAGAGGKTGAGGTSATGGTTATGTGPCDIYATANSKCVAAHSTIRALLGSYNGPLYQVKRKSDSTTKDIPLLSPGGIADSSVQDTFCAGTTCTITKVYDQSGHGNFVEAETKDAEDAFARPVAGSDGEKHMTAANATQESLTVGGHKVYSLYMNPGQAYWRDGSQSGMPIGSDPQGIYMVTSGTHYNDKCCFDYGNGETSRAYVQGPTMDAVNFSSNPTWGTGAGKGPWVLADLEGGLYSHGGGGTSDKDLTLTYTYVTAMEKNNGTGTFAIKGADAATGSLSTFYSGAVPPGYEKSAKQGAIVLGSGGDCCHTNWTFSQGTFYEGAIVAGYPSDATEDAIQANIVSAGYGK